MKKIKDEYILLTVYAIMSFSFGMWFNYRQLWLKDIGFDVSSISKLLSVSLICSSIIIFIISFFSNKINLKKLITLSLIFRTISLFTIMFVNDSYIVKVCMLLCIMCENIFSLTFYPLLSLVNKSNYIYKKQVSINYFAKDSAIILCGLLLGLTIGKYTIDYNTCLFIVYVCTLVSTGIMLFFNNDYFIRKNKFKKFFESVFGIFKDKKINYYLLGQFICEVGYNMIFGMLMLLLTGYLNIGVGSASIFIIVCSVLGSTVSKILSKKSDDFSLLKSYLIKYGSRILVYLCAFIINKPIFYIIAISVSYISIKILDDKVNGTFIREISDDSRFLFGNIRYFILNIADGIGVFIAGILFDISLSYLFFCAFLLTLISLIIFVVFIRK